MEKIYVIAIILLSIILVFSSGCIDDTGSQNTTGMGSDKKSAPYVGGEKSLDFSFHKLLDHIPKQEGVAFPIMLKVENKGSYTVGENNLQLKLLSPGLWNKGEENIIRNNRTIKGKKKVGDSVVPGGTTLLSFEGCSYTGVQQKAIPPDSVRIEACYPYETKVTSEICVVSKDIYTQAINSERICEPSGSKEVRNSAAPIHITKVKQYYSSPGKVIVELTVKKVEDKGTVYVGNCGSGNLNVSKVKIEDVSTSDSSVTADCEGDTISLLGGKGSRMCVLNNVDSGNNYKDILKVTLNYTYKKILSEGVQVFSTKSS